MVFQSYALYPHMTVAENIGFPLRRAAAYSGSWHSDRRDARSAVSILAKRQRPVRIIVPVAAGGPTDIVARMLAEKLSAMWGQMVFIENKAGAGNNIGAEFVARSDPDGYTVLFDPGSIAANTSLYRKLSYDAIADFAPVSLVTRVDYFNPRASRQSVWGIPSALLAFADEVIE